MEPGPAPESSHQRIAASRGRPRVPKELHECGGRGQRRQVEPQIGQGAILHSWHMAGVDTFPVAPQQLAPIRKTGHENLARLDRVQTLPLHFLTQCGDGPRLATLPSEVVDVVQAPLLNIPCLARRQGTRQPLVAAGEVFAGGWCSRRGAEQACTGGRSPWIGSRGR